MRNNARNNLGNNETTPYRGGVSVSVSDQARSMIAPATPSVAAARVEMGDPSGVGSDLSPAPPPSPPNPPTSPPILTVANERRAVCMTAAPDIARLEAAADSPGAVAGDIAADFVAFLIAKVPELAKEFAAGRPTAAEPAAPATPNWIQEMDAGQIISANDAAMVCNVTAQAIRDRCKRAERDGRPIGRCFVETWFISLPLLFDDIERTDDLHARRKAEANAEKLPKLGASKAMSLKK
jgi:hypothetical protein